MTGSTDSRLSQALAALADRIPEAINLRHAIHQQPFVGGEEGPTAELVAGALGRPEAASVAGGRLIRFGQPTGGAIALRAELDALPIAEETSVAWASGNGAMHACGHDVHLAALVAASLAIAEVIEGAKDATPLVVVLQPREECLPSGALDIVHSAEFKEQDIHAIIGVHVQPALTAGTFSAAPGAVNASADEFRVRIVGKGGHGAYPHTTSDPVVAAAHVVQALQYLVSRQSDPMSPTVITIGSIHGGDAPNAIPEAVELTGTVRTFRQDDRRELHAAIERTAIATASIHGCQAETVIGLGEPALVNDEGLAEELSRWITATGLTQAPHLRSCGADDFAYFTELVPGVMVFYGVSETPGTHPGLHSARFLPDDRHVGGVAATMVAGYFAAQQYLSGIDSPAVRTR